jgi:DNA topoisomerase I
VKALELRTTPQKAARAVSLRYVADDEPGYSPKPKGKKFIYLSPQGKVVSKPSLIKRFDALAIPPNYKNVWICKDETGHIQATGIDAKGRKQYIYHPRWRDVRDGVKFETITQFAALLPRLRERVDQDLKGSIHNDTDLSRERLVAALVRLLDKTLIRIGNETYAKENGSYGLTTLRKKHVSVDKEEVEFAFRGKSGQYHTVSLNDKALVKIIRACQELPGYELFKYVDEKGQVSSLGSADVNAYLQEVTEHPFTAKDFRTWAATVSAAEQLGNIECPEKEPQRKQCIVQAVKDVAKRLGNTPAVCRKSYIHPEILEGFLAGTFPQDYNASLKKARRNKTPFLSTEEKATLNFLERKQKLR